MNTPTKVNLWTVYDTLAEKAIVDGDKATLAWALAMRNRQPSPLQAAVNRMTEALGL